MPVAGQVAKGAYSYSKLQMTSFAATGVLIEQHSCYLIHTLPAMLGCSGPDP